MDLSERRGEEKRREESVRGGEGWDRGRRRDGDSEDGFSLLFLPLFFRRGKCRIGKAEIKVTAFSGRGGEGDVGPSSASGVEPTDV